MTTLTKFVLRRLMLLAGLFLVAVLAANQGLAIALLTPPPPASYPVALSVKAWSYLILSMALFVFDVWLLVKTIKRVNRTP